MSTTALLRWLTLLALLFAPLAMIGGSPAAAHAGPVAAGHCTETGEPAEAPPSAPAECMVACAGCLPMQDGRLADLPPTELSVQPAPVAFRIRGLHPEAATPPPRIS